MYYVLEVLNNIHAVYCDGQFSSTHIHVYCVSFQSMAWTLEFVVETAV